MKKLFVTVFVVLMTFMSGCSNIQVGAEEDTPFYGGGIVSIYLPNGSDSKTPYRVYINNEDTQVTLLTNKKTRFGIVEGKTNIQIVKGRETASINLFVNKSNEYYLRVMLNEQNKIDLLQVSKNALPKSAQNTELYIDEKAAEASADAKAMDIITNYGEESTMEENASITKYTKTPSNGDTIFYYELDDGE